jgi:cytochrome c oxidase assembly factor CtaG
VLIQHGGPVEPAEAWTAWNWDPVVWLVVLLPAVAYVALWRRAGRRDAAARWRRRSFLAGVAALAVALLSPLDAMGESLASAHMVQHLLLTTVAAPLLVLGVRWRVLVGGVPAAMRRRTAAWRTTSAGRAGRAVLAHPVVASLPFVAALWLWHAEGPYGAALDNSFVHAVEHACFLATALLSWAAILARPRRRAVAPGMAVLVLFGLAMVSGLLGLLLTFAPTPWYPAYAETTEAWGLTPLEDQQLAGVIMWVPGGGAYLIAALVLVILWIRAPAGSARRLPRPSVLTPVEGHR